LIDRHAPTLERAILAEFILEGYFAHHIRRMRQIYADRIAVLVDASRRKLAGRLDVEHAASDMRTVGWIQNGQKDRAVAERARSQGLEVAPLSQFAVRNFPRSGLILGFAGSAPEELRRGVDVLDVVLDRRAHTG
jgi:GntR family transcriptional regulator / MocR family aminotransferase